ncbi:MAG TPA: single-stranded DNA-binding protein [Actinospica sp.]|jgi:single-strand DNA-binding protein|nr:single-stranded DNA-binding protein [Actinospica sp.]
MPLNTTTISGNLTNDPELRFTPSGTSVANFTVASTDRVYDRSTSEWKDGSTLFMNCFAWKNSGAENIAESLTKGAGVMVTGKLRQRSYTTRDGEKRTVIELEVEEIGPSLRNAQAKPTKNQRAGAEYANQGADSWATAGA